MFHKQSKTTFSPIRKVSCSLAFGAAIWALLGLPVPSLLAQQCASLHPSGSFESGMRLFREGQPLEALQVFETGLKTDPQNVCLLNAAGSVLLLTDHPEKARYDFLEAIKLQPQFLPARKNLGVLLWKEGKDQESQEQFEFVLRHNQSDASSRLFLGLIASKQKRCGDAVQYLTGIPAALLESSPEALPALAKAYYECKNPLEGAKAFQRIASLPSLQGDQALLAGDLAAELGAYPEAATLLTAAREKSPGSSRIAYSLANAYFKLGHYGQAIELIRSLPQGGEQTCDLYNLLGRAYEKQGETDAAVEALRHAIKLDPHREDNYLDLSTICLDHNAADLADEIVGIGLKQIPNSYRLLVQRGVIKEKRGRHDEAAQCFQSALHLQPSDPLALLSLGIAYWQASALTKAATSFSEGIRRFPDDYRFYYFYGLVSEKALETSSGKAGNFDETIESLQRAIALNPSLADSHFVLGKVYACLNRKREAEKEFEVALRLNPGHVEAKYRLSQIYRELGRTEDALRLGREVQDARRKQLEQESQMRTVLVRK